MVKIVSWNVLAQTKIKRVIFPTCSELTLKWKHRRVLLQQKLEEFDADILCLQEVDFYEQWFRDMSIQRGYEGRYAQKKAYAVDEEMHVMNGGGDGLYVGFKKGFECVDYMVIDLIDTMLELVNSGATPNIAQCLHMQFNEKEFALINTHLYWAPGYDDLRLAQIKHILQIVTTKYPDLPMVLVGDLNSDPDSAACRWLREQAGFRAVCENEFTVYSPGFVDCLDHIFVYPEDKCRGQGIGLEDYGEIVRNEEGGIPCIGFPSDHVPICAHIYFDKDE